MGRVQGKVALVTGASRGIGKETAILLAKEGALVIATDILDEEGAELEKHDNIQFLHQDVSLEDDWKNAISYVRSNFSRLDILFNNAGILGLSEDVATQDPEHLSLDSWRKIHQINLDSVFLGCKYGISLMKSTGGSIINMSSRSGNVGIPSCVAYASSKAAIRNHTKSVALYCASQGYNIRCNSLHPGAVLTPIWDSVLENDPDAIKKLSKGIPLGEMGEPLDVANAVLYFGSDESKYITGAELVIDGGILAGSSSAPKSTK